MRSVLLGCATLMLAAGAPQALAFETEYGQGTNPTASAQYADPDEQFDAIANSGGGPVTIYNFGGSPSHTHPTLAASDQSVHWSAERIRTVFGPDAHY